MGSAAGERGRLTADRVLGALAAGSRLDARAMAVVVAHPDDEVIGAGARLPLLNGVSVMHATDGAPRTMQDAHAAGYNTREDYARARVREAEAALALAGILPDRVSRIGIADQEASLRLSELAHELARLFHEHAVEIVLTHAYEGGHPDHDAVAFAVDGAARLIAKTGGAEPAIIEMAGYHAGPHGLVTNAFLPSAEPGLTIELSPKEQALKRRMLACHASQSRTLAQFGVAIERYRRAPRYDFIEPPHSGQLWYEQFDWGMTGARWRTLAQQARAELGYNSQCRTA